jgi:tetratricopeptide (TPR) repeat protein
VLGFFNVFPFLYSYVADHFQHLATLGIIAPGAAGLMMVSTRLSISREGRAAASLLLLASLAALTWRQSGIYSDNLRLFRETLARNPDSSMAHNNVGYELSKMPGGLPEAITHFEAALRIDPDSAEAHENPGLALSKARGRLPDAVFHLESALKLQPEYPESHLNLGSALSKISSRLPEAIAQYQAALRIKLDYEEAHLDLGTAYSAPVHYSLGNALCEILDRLPEGD